MLNRYGKCLLLPAFESEVKMTNRLAGGTLFFFLLHFLLSGCATSRVGSFKSIEKRAYETRVYDATYEETWKSVMMLFQDLDLMPSFTDKTAGLIKAEVPYTDYKIGKKILLTCLIWYFAIPYWISTDQGEMIFTAYIKPVGENLTSVRLLGVNSKGKKVWKEKNYPELHNAIQEILAQKRFLEGLGSEIE